MIVQDLYNKGLVSNVFGYYDSYDRVRQILYPNNMFGINKLLSLQSYKAGYMYNHLELIEKKYDSKRT